MLSIVSPCAAMMAVPPSQLQLCAGACGCARGRGRHPPAEGGPEGAASAELSTLWLGAAGRTEPVTSLEAPCGAWAIGFEAHGLSENRVKSLLQPARPAARGAS